MRSAEYLVMFISTVMLVVGCQSEESAATRNLAIAQTEQPSAKPELEKNTNSGEASGQDAQRIEGERGSRHQEQTSRPEDGNAPQVSAEGANTQPRESSVPLTHEVLRGPWKPYDDPQGLGMEILIPESAAEDGIIRLLRELGQGKDPVSITVWTSRQAYENAQRNIYGDLYDHHLICVYTKRLSRGVSTIKWVQEKGRFSHLFGQTTSVDTKADSDQTQATKSGHAPTPGATSDVQTYMDVLRTAGVNSSIVVRASQRDNVVTVVVANRWHYEPYQIRLQMAENLWKLWARIRSPNDPDKARLELTDLNGNVVGGSRWLAGSLIWVQKN